MKLKRLITRFLKSEQKHLPGAELKLLFQLGYERFDLALFPKFTQRDCTERISANPKRTSSAGAEKNRMPVITSGSYMTMFLDVSHQFVRNWNGKIFAYELQNAALLSSTVFITNKSKVTAINTAKIEIWV
jgi:hypothetical protein